MKAREGVGEVSETMKASGKNRNGVARWAGGVCLLMICVLASACSVPSPVSDQPTADVQETPQTSSEGNESQPAPSGDTATVEIGATVENKNLNIEFLYLDLNVCGPCQGTEATLDEAVAEVRPILEVTGFHVNVTKLLVANAEQAQSLGFVSSPTIRINGRDMQPEVKEDLCDSCSGLCGDDVECRVWVYDGEEYWAPPKPMIITAIMTEAYRGGEQAVGAPSADTALPDNLQRFFAAKEDPASNDSSCCPPSNKCCG